MTQAEYARHRGVSRSAVSQKIKAGAIPFIRENGRILLDPDAVNLAWDANSDNTKKRDAEPEESSKVEIPKEGTIAAANLRKAETEADLKKLELQKKQGELLPMRVVESQVFDIVRITRDRIRGMPAKLAPQLAIEDSSAIVFEILQAECDAVLKGLSEGLVKESNVTQELAGYKGPETL
jgi:hypothetical protein